MSIEEITRGRLHHSLMTMKKKKIRSLCHMRQILSTFGIGGKLVIQRQCSAEHQQAEVRDNQSELIAYTLEPKYMCHDEKLNRSNRELVGLYNQIGLRRRNLIRKAYRRGSLGRDLKSQLKDILQLLKVAKNLHKDILDRGGTPAPIPAHFEDKKRFY